MLRIFLLLCCLAILFVRPSISREFAATTLCAADEQVIFSCPIKRPAKLVSLCASKDLTKTKGYLQYRFGLPGTVELEFPKTRESTQVAFKYKHYFRAQVDSTEISFTNAGYEYTVVDDYNGEEKPAVSMQGVTVTPSSGGKEVTLACRERAKANFSQLADILPVEPE